MIIIIIRSLSLSHTHTLSLSLSFVLSLSPSLSLSLSLSLFQTASISGGTTKERRNGLPISGGMKLSKKKQPQYSHTNASGPSTARTRQACNASPRLSGVATARIARMPLLFFFLFKEQRT